MIGARAYADVAAPPKLAASQCSGTPGLACSGVAAVLFGARQAGQRRACREHAADCRDLTSSRWRVVVLAIAASLLAGCATERSDGAPCPPVLDYSRDFLRYAAGELKRLPAGSAIDQMLADCQVMRDQARTYGR